MRRVCVPRPRYVRSVPTCERAGRRRRLAAEYGKQPRGHPRGARPARPLIFARILQVYPRPPRSALAPPLPSLPRSPDLAVQRNVTSRLQESSCVLARKGEGEDDPPISDSENPSTGVETFPGETAATRHAGGGPHINRYMARCVCLCCVFARVCMYAACVHT